jgi:hypothetical protein
MNIKLILVFALIIAVVIAYFSWDSVYGIRITVQELSSAYSEDANTADQKYLDKNLFIEGKVKAFYKIMGTRPVLEFELSPNSIPIFFFFATQESETYASNLQFGQKVVVKGKCLGKDEYSFVNGIKIDVEKFEK